jgi:hypothetical protein
MEVTSMGRRSRPVRAGTTIRATIDRVRVLARTPREHTRWDARFTRIEPLPANAPALPQRFAYVTRIGLGRRVEGWGEAITHRCGRATALRFGSEDPRSLIREGRGSWIFEPVGGSVRFRTVYDYSPRWGGLGRLIDRFAFRPLMTWATRWSFDRLRIWIERGLAPEASRAIWLAKVVARTALGLVWVVEGVIPKILVVRPEEIALVERSSLYWPTPQATLAALGVAEAITGGWILSGKAERVLALVAGTASAAIAGLVGSLEPAALADPYGGLVKNLGLLACAAAVWWLAPLAPRASRARSGAR